jgi:glycosyltransferase involved in cell wall biosynthesis
MNVLIISTEDYLGAGKATHRVYEVLKQQGHRVCFLVKHKTIPDPDIYQYSDIAGNGITDRIIGKWNNVRQRVSRHIVTNPDYYFFGMGDPYLPFDSGKVISRLPFRPDIIVFTWISRFLNAKHIYELAKSTGARVVAYPFDMSVFTGGCHYAWESEGFTRDCYPCPAIQSENGKRIPAQILEEKKRYYKMAKVRAVAATSSLLTQLQRSALFAGSDIQRVLIPINEKIFNASRRNEARQVLGLDAQKHIIFFGSSITNEKRKGIGYFLESLRRLKNIREAGRKEEVLVMIAGKEPENGLTGELPFPVRFTGYINDDNLLSLHYQAADVFVCTSIQDAGPMMINESVMCGTPVITFDMGVAADLVKDGITGYKVPVGDTEHLAQKLDLLFGEQPADLHGRIAAFGLAQTSFSVFPGTTLLQ